MNAIVPAETAARAFLQAALLRRVSTNTPIGSIAALAQELGRDPANTRKTLQALERDGLIAPTESSGPVLTSIGVRALQALDVAEGVSDVAGGILQLQHAAIRPNPLNPRTDFDEDGLAELAESIAGVDQVLVPLIVFPAGVDGMHTLAAGERRWRAVRALIADGRWPADRPLPAIEREEDPSQAALIGLVENGQREDLNLWDQAQAYVALMEATGWSARQCALKTGKSPRAVQEAVQVAQAADPDQVEAFKRGSIRWEDLRNGVRKPGEKTLFQLVASGHPDDAAELERRSSEGMRQLAVEDAQARADAAPQVDLEDLAPRRIELSAQQTLILLEVEAATRARPAAKAPLGPTVQLTSTMDIIAKANADAAHLVSEGLIAVTGPWPTCIALLKAGSHWLANQPGAFMTPEWKLRRARQAVGLDDARCDALEIDGEFTTDWLNVAKPPPPPQLSDEEALILLELYDWTQRQKKDARTSGAPVRHDFDRVATKALADRQLLYGLHGADYSDGMWRLSVGHKGLEALRARLPELEDASARSSYRAELHAELGVSAPKGGNGYATPWLNGSMEPDPAFTEKRRLRAEEQARAEESQRQMDEARERLTERFAKLEADMPSLTSEEAGRRLALFLEEVDAPAPWKLESGNYEHQFRVASGAAFDVFDAAGKIGMRLGVMALNLIAGVTPANWSFSGALTRERFEVAIVNVVMDAIATGEPDVPLTRERAAELATAQLDQLLRDEGIVYGEEDWDWTEAGADALASAILTDLENSPAEEAAA